MEGKKFDGDKTRYDLLPPKALDEFAKVLTFGANKYGPENWKQLDDLTNRYFAAAQRHLWAFKRGESHDDESGFHHLAHALCCIAFMLEDEFDKMNDVLEERERICEQIGKTIAKNAFIGKDRESLVASGEPWVTPNGDTVKGDPNKRHLWLDHGEWLCSSCGAREGKNHRNHCSYWTEPKEETSA